MTKEVLVSISGLHMAAGGMENEGDEPIEVLSAGTYYFKNGKHYVLFEEVAEGFSEATKTQIKWKDTDILEVTKKGLSNVHMIFEKNKKNRCYYETPFGQLNMGIFTTNIEVKEQEDAIMLRADYALDVNFEPLADCTIYVKVRARDAKDFSLHQIGEH
ncbi:MAG: DUF1934 domain-containing protein [Faecalimonas sp.]|nr:DUF1934 domain-containing protein [Faecalimonas sp.]